MIIRSEAAKPLNKREKRAIDMVKTGNLILILMVFISGSVDSSLFGIFCLVICAVIGIGLAVWSIVHMKLVGKGNPMDPFHHAITTRTANLMTDGPYRICRNPMLSGVFIYYIGVIAFLRSWQSVVIFIAFFLLMMFQVNREEKRLEQDFGEAYTEYKQKTKKLILYIW